MTVCSPILVLTQRQRADGEGRGQCSAVQEAWARAPGLVKQGLLSDSGTNSGRPQASPLTLNTAEPLSLFCKIESTGTNCFQFNIIIYVIYLSNPCT